MSDNICTRCNGEGSIHTGIDEAPTTQCPKCDGAGTTQPREQAAPHLSNPDKLAALLCCLYEGPEIQLAATMLIEQAMELEEFRAAPVAAPEAPTLPNHVIVHDGVCYVPYIAPAATTASAAWNPETRCTACDVLCPTPGPCNAEGCPMATTASACPTCKGNDSDAPCAYPSEGKPGCLRDTRLAATTASASGEPMPCPFCAAKPENFRVCGSATGNVVKCTACKVEVVRATEGEAVAAWNRRAAPVAQLDADLPPPGLRIAHAELSARLEREVTENLAMRMENRQYVERIRHLEREAGLLKVVADQLKARIEAADAHVERLEAAALATAKLAPMCERKTDDIVQRAGYEKTGYVLKKSGERICVSDGGAVAWFTLDQWNWLMFNRDHVEFNWPKPYGHGRTAGTASEAAPDAWVYECRQPLTDPVVWAEFFGRDKPSASTWVRNVRPLAYIGQHAAAKPLCPHCGTHEVELARTCHNSACTGYATPETIYEGWRAAAPSTQEGANADQA